MEPVAADTESPVIIMAEDAADSVLRVIVPAVKWAATIMVVDTHTVITITTEATMAATVLTEGATAAITVPRVATIMETLEEAVPKVVTTITPWAAVTAAWAAVAEAVPSAVALAAPFPTEATAAVLEVAVLTMVSVVVPAEGAAEVA